MFAHHLEVHTTYGCHCVVSAQWCVLCMLYAWHMILSGVGSAAVQWGDARVTPPTSLECEGA